MKRCLQGIWMKSHAMQLTWMNQTKDLVTLMKLIGKNARKMADFLGHFHDLTLRVSSTLHVTIDSFFFEIGEVLILIKEWMDSADPLQAEMGKRMKDKFDKYWGTWQEQEVRNKDRDRERGKGKEKEKEKEKENMNLLIFVAAVLDPRYKLSEYTMLAIEEMFGEEIGQKVWAALKKCVRDLYAEYKNLYAPSDGTVSSQAVDSQQQKDVKGGMMKSLIAQKLRLTSGNSGNTKSELEKYLTEDTEEHDKKIDILAWWKANSSRFPILSCLAHDVLAIPISTVASESTFSTSGRILDDFRTSLTPLTLEALVCTQDWLRRSTPVNIQENMEKLAAIEQELLEEYGESSKGKRKASTTSQTQSNKSSKPSNNT